MSICTNCGVELEDDMNQCPLCGIQAGMLPNKTLEAPELTGYENLKRAKAMHPQDKSLLQRILWQVTSILLFSGIISTLIIDLAVHKTITWSVYPVTVSMIIFTYASLFAFWRTKKIYQIIAGLLISSAIFILLDILLSQPRWPIRLGLPLLFAVNFVAMILVAAIDQTKHRGLNVIAYSSVAIAVLCISIESILSFYSGKVILQWSVIVAACMLPVTAALFFMHNRIKKNPDMEKIFHR